MTDAEILDAFRLELAYAFGNDLDPLAYLRQLKRCRRGIMDNGSYHGI